LFRNDSGHFECRWIKLKINKNSKSKFLNGMDKVIWCPVAHGEGKFFASVSVLNKIEKDNLVAFRYVDEKGSQTQNYPDNPNGSLRAIAGISDETGRILGLMPHPECFVRVEQHPNWRRGEIKKPQGLPLFKNIVAFVKNA
jgi:phosphoribosylformylglycinamidine (FGAM) synthase-like amidotransferase family enzyme